MRPTEATSDEANLDYSTDKSPFVGFSPDPTSPSPTINVSSLVDEKSRGVRGKDGLYEVKDLDFGGERGGDMDHSDSDEANEDAIISRTINGLAARRSKINELSSKIEEPTAGNSRFGGLGSLFSRLIGSSRTLTKEDLEPVLAGMKEHLMQKNVAQEIAGKICDGIGTSLVGKRVSGYRGAMVSVYSITALAEGTFYHLK
jgi:signal recognition particle receptor subunit alpha